MGSKEVKPDMMFVVLPQRVFEKIMKSVKGGKVKRLILVPEPVALLGFDFLQRD